MPLAPLIVAFLVVYLDLAAAQSLVQRTEWLEGRGGYSVEDFFWSGSGEGSGEDPPTAWVTTTVFRTLLTTVYPTPVFPCPTASADDCFIPSPTSAVPTLPSASPSLPPVTPSTTTPAHRLLVPDQSFWLATVIRHNASLSLLDPDDLEHRLAEVYRAALRREDVASWDVGARLHQVRRAGRGVELAWSVSVSGKPQPPSTALRTLATLLPGHLQDALGYPIIQQPEPYLKSLTELEIASTTDTWKLIGLFAVIFCILIILLLLFLLIRSKKMKSTSEDKSTEPPKNEGVQTMLVEGDLHGKHWSTKHTTERDVHNDRKDCREVAVGNGRRSSPTSYLSMPSIKAFPRDDSLPVPIDKLLGAESHSGSLSRHHSDTKDPGVIGPAVWDLHCHRFSKLDERKDLDDSNPHHMRKRFHELLDDAFSIFSSKCPSSQEDATSPSPSQSSAKMPSEISSRMVQSAGSRSRRAWDRRPMSAGPRPVIEPSWILSESHLRSTDPAVPLIEAIKHELEKFPSAPSTSYS